MCVIDPVKLIFTNVPEDYNESITINKMPKDPSKGTRVIHLTKEIYVDSTDVSASEGSWQRISVGSLVGLKYGCSALITSIEIVNGKQTIKAEKYSIEEKKPKGFVHWISIEDAIECEVRLYDLLFTVENPNKLKNYLDGLNPNSCEIFKNSKMNKDLCCNIMICFLMILAFK